MCLDDKEVANNADFFGIYITNHKRERERERERDRQTDRQTDRGMVVAMLSSVIHELHIDCS
jgi:hypothetical protein